MYSNPELDMIQKDIDELVKERLILETEIAQKEADLKIRSGEVKSLQVNDFVCLCVCSLIQPYRSLSMYFHLERVK